MYGVPSGWDRGALYKYCRAFGDIVNISKMTPKHENGKPKSPIGTATFYRREDAERMILNTNGKIWCKGQEPVSVKWSKFSRINDKKINLTLGTSQEFVDAVESQKTRELIFDGADEFLKRAKGNLQKTVFLALKKMLGETKAREEVKNLLQVRQIEGESLWTEWKSSQLACDIYNQRPSSRWQKLILYRANFFRGGRGKKDSKQ